VPTRWGILGPGRIAHKFVADLLTLPDAELWAVASTDAGRAADFARQYSIPNHYGRYEDLPDCAGLDVVYVATPHVLHHQNALMLLQGGVAVLGEKPFAMNLNEVQEMADMARSQNVFLMEALWSRFMPALLAADEQLRSGIIGQPTLLRADFGFPAPFLPDKRLFNKSLGGGALLDIGIYPLFLAYWLFGMPDQIEAVANFGPTGVDEQTAILLHYADGRLAVLDCTLRAKTRCEALIYGPNGHLHIPTRWHEAQTLTVAANDHAPQTMSFSRTTFGYDYEAQHVMDCLRQGLTESPLWSLTDSLNLMTLLDTVRQKAGIVYEIL
jgi:predicted dehydrogenase